MLEKDESNEDVLTYFELQRGEREKAALWNSREITVLNC
jgi:hypothetical protein